MMLDLYVCSGWSRSSNDAGDAPHGVRPVIFLNKKQAQEWVEYRADALLDFHERHFANRRFQRSARVHEPGLRRTEDVLRVDGNRALVIARYQYWKITADISALELLATESDD